MKHISGLIVPVIAAAVFVGSGIPLLARPASMGAAAQAGAQADTHADDTVVVVELQPVKGELQGKLDAKSAKVGDSVVVKTEAAVKVANGLEIPRGARLVGHVTEVQAHDKTNADSHISLLFDRAEWKGGQPVAIRSSIESLEPSEGEQAMAAAQGKDSAGVAPSGDGGRLAGHGGGGGGGAMPSANSSAGAGAGARPGGIVGDATSDADSSGHAAGSGAGAQATRLPGISLSSATTGSASVSGTLYASKRNVHLNDGTQIMLGVAAAPAAH